MALLQIAEPGQSPLPHQVKRAVGIDLGTTNSLVATVRGGRPARAGGFRLPRIRCHMRRAKWFRRNAW